MKYKRKVLPIELKGFLLATGWSLRTGEVIDGVVFMVSEQFPGCELRVPADPTYRDQDSVIDTTLERYCDLTGEDGDEVRFRIVHLHDDVMRIRVKSSQRGSALPLSFVSVMLPMLRKLLLAGGAIGSRRRRLRLIGDRDDDAARGLGAMFEAPEADSRVFSIACPLAGPCGKAVRPVGASYDCDPPIARRVMISLHDKLNLIVGSIEGQGLDDVMYDAARGAGPLSAELCEALLCMHEPWISDSLEVSFVWSPEYPVEHPSLCAPIRIDGDYFSVIAKIYQTIKETERPVNYVGTIVHLEPVSPDQEHSKGRALLSLLRHDGAVVPARAELSESDYATAKRFDGGAGILVKASGVLKAACDPSRYSRMMLTQISNFEVLPFTRTA